LRASGSSTGQQAITHANDASILGASANAMNRPAYGSPPTLLFIVFDHLGRHGLVLAPGLAHLVVDQRQA
jgi:hypothetical protein